MKKLIIGTMFVLAGFAITGCDANVSIGSVNPTSTPAEISQVIEATATPESLPTRTSIDQATTTEEPQETPTTLPQNTPTKVATKEARATATSTQQPAAPSVGGQGIGDAPLLENGSYPDTIDTGTTRYYAFYVGTGQKVRVAAVVDALPDAPDRFLARDAKTELKLFDPELKEIGADAREGVGVEDKDLSLVSPEGDLEPGVYYASVSVQDVLNRVLSGKTFNTTFLVEVTGDNTGATAPDWSRSVENIHGGGDYGDAAILAGGFYTDTIAANSAHYYAVELEPGERIRVVAIVKALVKTPDDYLVNDAKTELKVFDANKKELFADARNGLGKDDKVLTAAIDPASASEAGTYYLTVSTQADKGSQIDNEQFAVEITVEKVPLP